MKACHQTGKVRYGSAVLARIALNEAMAKGFPVQRRYQCQFCKGWHLTSQEFDPEKGTKKAPPA